MKPERYLKESFCVIGKEGSSLEGAGFVQRLWDEANSHFPEVQPLAKKNSDGSLAGIWGAMTDFSRSFRPWSDHFSKGLYLAGVECPSDAIPPAGWSKWIIPGFEYLRIRCEHADTFSCMIEYLESNDLPLVGAVQDYTCPQTGDSYMLFPIRRI